jgi:uncharacterized protein
LKKINYLSIILFCLSFGLIAQNELPEKPDSWVNDYTSLLSNNQKSILTNKLNVLEKETSTQIFLAIFDRMPESYYLEDFVVKLYEKWRPGRKNENNGVLIVLFSGDRRIRIEVGYGLEHVLTDMQAGRIIEDYMKPEFRKENYFAGLNKGIDVIISAVKGEYKIPAERKSSRSKSTNWFSWLAIFFIIISVLRRFGSRGTTITRKGSRYSRTTWGGPFFFGGGGGGGSSFGGGGGFSGGFGGLSGGGGASGSW